MDSFMVQPRSIQNKADALHFAVLATMKSECGVGNSVDYEEAKKLFDFFCENVEFPEENSKKLTDGLMTLLDGLIQKETEA